jgi:type II secretory pathway pseudopilin PulG
MKPVTPHDPFDDLIVAALHGELTPEERTQLEARLSHDPAAQAAYQEAQAMHDLLEKNYKSAQPDAAFEQRMVSGVRRKIQREQHRETAWESLVVLFNAIKRIPIPSKRLRFSEVIVVLCIIAVLLGVAFGPITHGIKQAQESAALQQARQAYLSKEMLNSDAQYTGGTLVAGNAGQTAITSGANSQNITLGGATAYSGGTTVTGGTLVMNAPSPGTIKPAPAGQDIDDSGTPDALSTPKSTPPAVSSAPDADSAAPIAQSVNTGAGSGGGEGGVAGGGFAQSDQTFKAEASKQDKAVTITPGTINHPVFNLHNGTDGKKKDFDGFVDYGVPIKAVAITIPSSTHSMTPLAPPSASTTITTPSLAYDMRPKPSASANADDQSKVNLPSESDSTPAVPDTRKLIRNAQLDLEVKSFQTASDQITAMTKDAGGYVDTSNSQKGGNGKLQGTVVVKVLPQNLDGFLLKLRDLGTVNNQSVSTDDVTKDYFDTQARLDNSRRMETQLQDLLQHENSKVSDLLAVERELGRVRGEIEQMQGQLKLYDFEVQYATVTINLSEKDLNQAAAYLLKEQDDFSLYATDVEGTFQKARKAADDFKGQILTATLNHNSGSDVSAELEVMIAPDQIEAFLDQVRSLGRVDNFTRQTQRVAKDGGDSDQPADQTLTEKDKVQVHLSIRSDDDSRKQVALTVVTKSVEDALDQAKAAALAHAGVEILSSSLNKAPEGQSTAQLSVRVPGSDYSAVMSALQALGRTSSLSIQRNDNSGPGANGDDSPVIVALSLTDDDTPLQQTEMSILASDVDNEARQLKQDATAAGVAVKASSFERQPDGTETAQMTFRLPLSQYPAFVESLKKLGKVESLSVHRDDRPDQGTTDETAPAEISLTMHNQGEVVPDNSGLWATLRETFGEGAGALFGSVRTIGVVVAFLTPWLVTIAFIAWVGRRIYVMRKK